MMGCKCDGVHVASLCATVYQTGLPVCPVSLTLIIPSLILPKKLFNERTLNAEHQDGRTRADTSEFGVAASRQLPRASPRVPNIVARAALAP
jgi:hypothetical protein